MFVLSRDPVPKADPKYPKCLPTLMLIAVATWVHDVHLSLQVWDPSHMPKGKGKGRRPDLKLAMKLAETPDAELTSRPQPGKEQVFLAESQMPS